MNDTTQRTRGDAHVAPRGIFLYLYIFQKMEVLRDFAMKMNEKIGDLA